MHRIAAICISLFWLISGPAWAAELVMVEQHGCPYCRQWDREVGEIYSKTPEGRAASLVRVDLRDVQRNTTGYDFARPVNFTPTFVLVEDGAELARIEGYMGDNLFWGMLGLMLKAQIGFEPATPAGG